MKKLSIEGELRALTCSTESLETVVGCSGGSSRSEF